MLGVAQGEARVISPVHALWFAAVPIFDCLTCFVRRALQGKSPFTAGHDHFRHILRRGGFGVRQKPGILTGTQLIYAIIGLAGHFAGVPDYVMFAAWSVLGRHSGLSSAKSPNLIDCTARTHKFALDAHNGRGSALRATHMACHNSSIRFFCPKMV
jgi:hypothetical protein